MKNTPKIKITKEEANPIDFKTYGVEGSQEFKENLDIIRKKFEKKQFDVLLQVFTSYKIRASFTDFLNHS